MNVHVLFHCKCIRIGGGKNFALRICPPHKTVACVCFRLNSGIRIMEIQPAARLYRTVIIAGRHIHAVIVFCKISLDENISFHYKGIGIVSGKTLIVRICPLLKMITVVRLSRQPGFIIIRIGTASQYSLSTVDSKYIHNTAVPDKIRPNLRMLFHHKRIGIIRGKTLAVRICPLLKMITVIRLSHYPSFRIIRIHTAAQCYPAVVGVQLHLVISLCKMRLNKCIPRHGKRIGIIGRKKVSPAVCPFYKTRILIRGSRHCRLCVIRILIPPVRLCRTAVFIGRHIHGIAVQFKICLNDSILLYYKCIRIDGGKKVPRLVRPLLKMIMRICLRLYRRLCIIRPVTFARLYRTVGGGIQLHGIVVRFTMCLKDYIPVHSKLIRIGGGNSTPRPVRPLRKMITVVRHCPYRCRFHIPICVIALRYRTVDGRQTRGIIVQVKISH
ncbi:hypothetical protein Barb7_01840 [Bacteroidales bacterium Barb7]|nr:hypothetical protein Barb7_01840 [Bacteroidales bacterium Barb7]